MTRTARQRTGSASRAGHSSRSGDAEAPASRISAYVLVFYTLIWCYEGIARKWIPGTDSLLYVFRDGMLLIVFLFMLMAGFPRARSTLWFWGVSLLLGVLTGLQIIGGSIGLTAGVIGLRSYVAPFLLLAFLLTFPPRRLVASVSWVVLTAILVNLPLVVLQVMSAPDALINREIGGEAAYFVNPGDIVRPTGTFSSSLGLVALLQLGLALGLAAVVGREVNRALAVVAVVASVLMTVVSGARSAVISALIILVFFVWMQLRRGSIGSVLGLTGVIGIAGLAAYWSLALFPAVAESFNQRVELAGQAEDTDARVFAGVFGFLETPLSILGSGLGAGSNASVLEFGTTVAMETEADKWVYELGVLGLVLALLRLVIVAGCLLYTFLNVQRMMPHVVMMMSVFCATLLFGGITKQPTTQGAFALMLVVLLSAVIERGAPTRRSARGVTNPPRSRRHQATQPHPSGYAVGHESTR